MANQRYALLCLWLFPDASWLYAAMTYKSDVRQNVPQQVVTGL